MSSLKKHGEEISSVSDEYSQFKSEPNKDGKGSSHSCPCLLDLCIVYGSKNGGEQLLITRKE